MALDEPGQLSLYLPGKHLGMALFPEAQGRASLLLQLRHRFGGVNRRPYWSWGRPPITSLHGPFRLEFVIERVSLARMRFFPFGLLVGTASLSLCYGQPYQATGFKV